MTRFLHAARIALTPLSPIHIGSGEDYEPTDYVIEDGVLYSFDPARAMLPENLRNRLSTFATQGDLLGIQKFFLEHARHFIPLAGRLVPVSSGIADEYARKIGKVVAREADGKKIFNQFFIARCMRNHGDGEAYVPGSSFKGAIRTALLDRLNHGAFILKEQEESIERDLLGGDFQTSPLRLLKIGDFASQYEAYCEVVYATRHKKRPPRDPQARSGGGITTRREVVAHGQYRLFQADAVIQDLGEHDDPRNTPRPARRIADFLELGRICNRYYLPQLRGELQMLDTRGLIDPAWRGALEGLLNAEFKDALTSGRVFIVRLGQHGGAESKTFRGEGVARIKINLGKGRPPRYDSVTTTISMASRTERDRSAMLPFGWALAEIDPEAESPRLQAWCAAQSGRRVALETLRAKHTALKQAYEQAKAQAAREKAEAEARERAAKEAAAAREAQLAAMGENRRAIVVLCEELDKAPRQKQPGGPLFEKVFQTFQQALSESWSVDERRELVEKVYPRLESKMPLGKREKEFKALRRQLRGEGN